MIYYVQLHILLKRDENITLHSGRQVRGNGILNQVDQNISKLIDLQHHLVSDSQMLPDPNHQIWHAMKYKCE